MSVVHVNISAFGIEVERLVDPRLRDRPVALAVSAAPRAPLVLVSSEAFQSGVRSGDRACDAFRLEPRLKILPQRPERYARAQGVLLKVVDRFTPVYEAARLGSFYLDMDGMEGLFGPPPDAAGKIHGEIRRALNLQTALGIAENKLVSRIAAQVIRPRGLCDVFPGNEAGFIAPLAIEYLPGVGEKTQQRLLSELGVRQIRDLAGAPLAVLVKVFGKQGETLYAQARGVDPEPVRRVERETTLSETATLAQESNDEALLLARLWQAVEKLGAELRRRRWVAARARLEAVYLDRERVQRELALVPATQFDFTLFRHLAEAWKKLIVRRVALKSLSVHLSRLAPQFSQGEIFDDGREARLLQALDRIRDKYGAAVIGVRRER